jgi:hypothetical protein
VIWISASLWWWCHALSLPPLIWFKDTSCACVLNPCSSTLEANTNTIVAP